MSKDLQEMRKSAMWLSVGGVFQIEVAINAKAVHETMPNVFKK
jgi:hypothetical protein